MLIVGRACLLSRKSKFAKLNVTAQRQRILHREISRFIYFVSVLFSGWMPRHRHWPARWIDDSSTSRVRPMSGSRSFETGVGAVVPDRFAFAGIWDHLMSSGWPTGGRFGAEKKIFRTDGVAVQKYSEQAGLNEPEHRQSSLAKKCMMTFRSWAERAWWQLVWARR